MISLRQVRRFSENGLEVLEEICPLSARVVVNQVSMKMENEDSKLSMTKNYFQNK